MRLLYSFLFLLNLSAYSQCVNSATITRPNYAQTLTQSNTFISISSSVYPSSLVRLDANPSNGYVLMNPGFVSAPNGNSAFIAQTLDGCGALAPAKMTNIDVIGKNVQEISIYPNPATEILNLYSNITILNYKIYALDGKEIIPTRNINNTKEEINVSNLAQGFYIIYVETETSEILTYKFIKE